MHTTYTNLNLQTPEPIDSIGMDASEIVNELRKQHDIYIEHNAPEGYPEITPLNHWTAYMKEVFDAISDPARWKNPVIVFLPGDHAQWVIAAFIWYFGDRPTVNWLPYGGVAIWTKGYQCW